MKNIFAIILLFQITVAYGIVAVKHPCSGKKDKDCLTYGYKIDVNLSTSDISAIVREIVLHDNEKIFRISKNKGGIKVRTGFLKAKPRLFTSGRILTLKKIGGEWNVLSWGYWKT